MTPGDDDEDDEPDLFSKAYASHEDDDDLADFDGEPPKLRLRKRKGSSNRPHQVWVHWENATDAERRYTQDEVRRNRVAGSIGEAKVRRGDHVTAGEAARSLRRAEVTRLEGIVADAVRAAGTYGLTWDEAPEATGLRSGSISPRWKPLRNQLRICFALEADA